jgi:hypothetical protein
MIKLRLPRMLACACLALPLAACENNSDAAKVGQLLLGQITGIGGSENVSRNQAAAIPYATLGVRLGSSAEAMFVLEAKSGSNLQWVGGTQFAIATRDGRVLRTTGFVHNLYGFHEEAANGTQGGVHEYRYDLADLNAYGVLVHCTERDAGQEQIGILGDAHATRHMIDDCVAPELDWNFSNEFWKDAATGYVWRSVQFVHPGLDPLELETLRPVN